MTRKETGPRCASYPELLAASGLLAPQTPLTVTRETGTAAVVLHGLAGHGPGVEEPTTLADVAAAAAAGAVVCGCGTRPDASWNRGLDVVTVETLAELAEPAPAPAEDPLERVGRLRYWLACPLGAPPALRPLAARVRAQVTAEVGWLLAGDPYRELLLGELTAGARAWHAARRPRLAAGRLSALAAVPAPVPAPVTWPLADRLAAVSRPRVWVTMDEAAVPQHSLWTMLEEVGDHPTAPLLLARVPAAALFRCTLFTELLALDHGYPLAEVQAAAALAADTAAPVDALLTALCCATS